MKHFLTFFYVTEPKIIWWYPFEIRLCHRALVGTSCFFLEYRWKDLITDWVMIFMSDKCTIRKASMRWIFPHRIRVHCDLEIHRRDDATSPSPSQVFQRRGGAASRTSSQAFRQVRLPLLTLTRTHRHQRKSGLRFRSEKVHLSFFSSLFLVGASGKFIQTFNNKAWIGFRIRRQVCF